MIVSKKVVRRPVCNHLLHNHSAVPMCSNHCCSLQTISRELYSTAYTLAHHRPWRAQFLLSSPHWFCSTTEVHSQLGSSMHETAVDGVMSFRSFSLCLVTCQTIAWHSPLASLILSTRFPCQPRASLELHTRFPCTCHSLTYYVPRARLVLTTRWPDTCHSMAWFLLLAGVELVSMSHGDPIFCASL
jgi:hypothetical protein